MCICMKLHNYCVENRGDDLLRGVEAIESECFELESRHGYEEAKECIRDRGIELCRRGANYVPLKRQMLCEHVREWDRRRPVIAGIATYQPG